MPGYVSAAAIGISPGSLVLETLPTERQTLSFRLSRANPSTDLFLGVTVSGPGSEAITLSSGDLLKLPKGEQAVSYSFLLDARKLTLGESYAPVITFLAKDDEASLNEDGNKIQIAVNGKVNVRVVEKLTEEKKEQSFSVTQDVPEAIKITNVRVKKSDQSYTKEIFVDVLNTLPESIRGLPYEMNIFSQKTKVGSLRAHTSTLMESNKETSFSFPYTFSRPGIYRIELVLGKHTQTKHVLVFAPYLGMQRVLFSPIPPILFFVSALIAILVFIQKAWLKRKGKISFLWISLFCLFAGVLWCANVFLLLGRFDSVSLSDLALQKGMVYLKKEGGDDEIFSLLTGNKQALLGEWNVFASSGENTFLFPSTNTSFGDGETGRFFRINNQGIMAAPTSVLPGVVLRVEESVDQSHVLFEGMTPENTRFTCLAEMRAFHQPNCSWMKGLGITDAEDVQFSKKTPQYVLYKQQGRFFAYDLWMQTTFLSQESGITIVSQKENTVSALTQKTEKGFLPWVFLGEEYFFFHPMSEIFSLGDQLFLEVRSVGSEQEVFLLVPQKKQRAFLARVKKMDEIYFLKKGARITTP